jgi:hypothetical protein
LQGVKSRIITAIAAVLLAATGAAPVRAQIVVGTGFVWGWHTYWPNLPYRYGPQWFGWIGQCSAGLCVDSPYLRRAIQREIVQFEHLRDLEQRTQPSLHTFARPLYLAAAGWPPPTPEAHVQPAYRRSGEIRPEFSATGQLRE